MKIFGMTSDNPMSWKILNHIKEENPDAIVRFDAVSGEAEIDFDEVFLMHEGSEQNFRPYMQMLGMVRSFKPQSEKLPYGIDNIDFGRRSPEVMFIYHFSNEEIKGLIDRGYYNKGFRVPSTFTTATFQLPIKCDLALVSPDKSQPAKGDNVPLLVVSFGDTYSYDIDGTTSGYENLAEYFDVATDTFERQAYDDLKEASLEDLIEEALGVDIDNIVHDVENNIDEQVEESIIEEPEVDTSEIVVSVDEIPETEEEIESRLYEKMKDMRHIDISFDDEPEGEYDDISRDKIGTVKSREQMERELENNLANMSEDVNEDDTEYI